MKKFLEEGFTPISENPSENLDLVIQGELVYVDNRAESTPFCIKTAENKFFDAGLDYCPGAHDARLHGHVEGTIQKPIVPERIGRHIDGKDLRMGSGSGRAVREVMGPCDDLPLGG
nr:hypothetical protein [Syntrophorhabdus aromaticivorans]